MKNKKFWDWARDSNTDERVLYFNGEISEETWWGDEVTPRLFRDELFGGETGVKRADNITIWLNSPGGRLRGSKPNLRDADGLQGLCHRQNRRYRGFGCFSYYHGRDEGA